jgi:uncharacterized protein
MIYKYITILLLVLFQIDCRTFTKCAGCRLLSAYEDPLANKLVYAAVSGMTWRVESLVKDGADPNHLEEGKIHPLIWTICAENVEGFEALLKAGADPNLGGTGSGWGDGRIGNPFSRVEDTIIYGEMTALLIAASHPDSRFLKLAIQYGGDVNLKAKVPEKGISVPRTPVINAAYHGLLENVKILVEAGADINSYEGSPENPVTTVARDAITVTGQFDIAYWALENGYTLDLEGLANVAELRQAGTSGERAYYKKKVIDLLIAKGYKFPRPNGFVIDEVRKREVPESEIMNIVYGIKSWHDFPEKPKKMPWEK